MKNIYKKVIHLFLITIFIQGLYAGSSGNIIRSLIFPGWGEYKINETTRAKVFLASELSILGTYLIGDSFNRWYIDQYTGFGALHANVSMDGKDYAFIVNMSNYDSMEDYNHYMMIHHNLNYFDDIYDDPSYNWEWDSTTNRLEFNDLRKNSLFAEKVTEFAIAALIINRIASVIDVIYLENNKKSDIDINAFLVPEKNNGVSLNISFSLK